MQASVRKLGCSVKIGLKLMAHDFGFYSIYARKLMNTCASEGPVNFK